MPEKEIIIIVDGGGAKAGAVEWLRHACKNKLYTNETNAYKSVQVMSLAEFIAWANRIFR